MASNAQLARAHRDADEEALQAALLESVQCVLTTRVHLLVLSVLVLLVSVARRLTRRRPCLAAIFFPCRPDFLAEILQAETVASPTTAPAQPPQALTEGLLVDAVLALDAEQQSVDEDDEDDDLAALVDHSLQLADHNVDDGEDEEDDGTLY